MINDIYKNNIGSNHFQTNFTIASSDGPVPTHEMGTLTRF
jgi:hypothetical protein